MAGDRRHACQGARDRDQQLYTAGLSSRTIREVLPCVDSGQASPAAVDRLLAERSLIDQRITDPLAARDRLDEVIEVARNPTSDCAHL